MSASKKKQARREASLAGDTLTEKQKQELKKAAEHKRNVIVGTIVGVILAVLIIILLVWHSGIVPRNTTALTVGDTKYTIPDVEYQYRNTVFSYYQQESYYAQLIEGYTPAFSPYEDLSKVYIDPNADEPQSYRDYFLDVTKDRLVQITALANAAKAAGYNTISAEGQADIEQELESLDSAMKSNNYTSRTAYLQAVYNTRAMNEKVYLKNLKLNILVGEYGDSITSTMSDYSPEELDAYYKENPDLLDSYSYNYAYFDGSVASVAEEGEEAQEPTDAEKTAAMEAAKKLADQALLSVKGRGGEDTFSSAVSGFTASYSSDRLTMGNSLPSYYAEWMRSADRKAGDADVFEVSGSGYYLVEFLGRKRDDTPTADVRHILVATNLEDDPNTADVDERLNENDKTVIVAKNKAESILNEFLAGQTTAEAFGELADKYSDDGRQTDGSLYSAGGLYTDVTPGQMVQRFNDWVFTDGRQDGDTGLVLTEFGWHVMFYQSSHDPAWMANAESAKSSADQTAWMESISAGLEAVETNAFQQVGH